MPRNWEEARDWVASGAAAPLVVFCPRCGRGGSVTAQGGGHFAIAWRDDAHGWTWRDADVTPAELASPEFGCGHDRRTEGGFVGGAPWSERPR